MAEKGERELSYLEQYYQKDGSQLVILYGQRHMAVFEMLKSFCRNKPYTFYRARSCSEREQLFQWAGELQRAGSQIPEHPKYREIFDVLTENKTPQKRVILIEEFHHMVKQDGAFMPQLVHFLKNEEKNQEIMVVLCSSSSGWVENSMVSRIGSALYSISGLIKIKELGICELRSHFPDNSLRDWIGFYAVLGGFPDLWQHFENGCSVRQNICRHILAQGAFLQEEAPRMVSQQLRETGVYYTILSALAAGKQKLNELYLHTGFSRAKISVYLKNLMELELVEKVFSYDTAGRVNAQKGIYRIQNRLVLFYFRYLYPNLSDLAMKTPEEFYEAYIEKDFLEFSRAAFVQACREILERKNAAGELPFVYTKTGEWVGKAGSIDVIAENEEGKNLIALCSWKEDAVSFQEYEKLSGCAKKARIRADHVYLFSASGFEERLQKEAEKKKSIHLSGIELF